MLYKFKCRACHEFIFLKQVSDENTNYNCLNCQSSNWIDSSWQGLEEATEEEFEKSKIDSNESSTEVKKTLSQKYNVLELYKGLAFLLMIAATGFFIYSLVLFFDAPKAARKILENAIITSTVSYFITMFSLFCLTKIIDFLFDLDKQYKILAPDKISSEEE